MVAAAVTAAAQAPVEPVPSAAQLRWQRMEVNAFVHFGPNAFTGAEWGTGREQPAVFNPTQLDARQWVRSFKAAGMKGVVVTAKHHDGFCLWPTPESAHTVAASPWRGGKGDLLRELSEAARAEGLKFGVYLSPWDRNHPSYGTPAYNDVFVRMLEDVLSNYGEIFEVWFDGANGEGPNGKRQVYDWPRFHEVVRRLQPNAVIFSDAGPGIRWIGNERGEAPLTNWAMLDRDRYAPGTGLSMDLPEGSELGRFYVPGECDVSIRPGWFWRAAENARVKSPRTLLRLYEASVGRNCTLLLNVPPDDRGLIHDNDVEALAGMKALVDRVYGTSLLPAAAKVTASLDGRGSSGRGGPRCRPRHLVGPGRCSAHRQPHRGRRPRGDLRPGPAAGGHRARPARLAVRDRGLRRGWLAAHCHRHHHRPHPHRRHADHHRVARAGAHPRCAGRADAGLALAPRFDPGQRRCAGRARRTLSRP